MADEFVSVKAGTGRRVTVARAYAEGIKDVEILDVPATDRRGRPLPASRLDGRRVKPRTTVKKAAAKKAVASKSTDPVAPTTGGSAAETPERGTA